MTLQRIHQDVPALTYGAKLADAHAVAILLHGRGASAQSMADLAAHLPTDGIAYVLPQAANHTWYPNSGFAPFAANEPYLSSALATVEAQLEKVIAAGFAADKIILGGFSQGASLMSEFVARHAQRYGGLLVFSGALLGPLDTPRTYDGSLDGTPVFIGGATHDAWVSEVQLRDTAKVLTALGGQVSLQITPGSDHTIRPSEIEQASAIINRLS